MWGNTVEILGWVLIKVCVLIIIRVWIQIWIWAI